MGVIRIEGLPSTTAHDMAAKGDKLYLATQLGLLTSTITSEVCTVS